MFPKPSQAVFPWPKKTIEFDFESILQDFAEVPDPRSHVNQRHLLGDIIVISVMVVVAGVEPLRTFPERCHA